MELNVATQGRLNRVGEGGGLLCDGKFKIIINLNY